MWGQMVKGIGCPKCKAWVDAIPELFNMLTVPKPSNGARATTLCVCIRNFFDQEKAGTCTECPRCGFQQEKNHRPGIEQKYVLTRLPEYLPIVLKRNSNTDTVDGPVSAPEVLDMSEHVFRTNHNMFDGSTYDLMGKVLHLGTSPTDGFYIAHVNIDGLWYKMEDDAVTPLTADDRAQAERSANILFYRRHPGVGDVLGSMSRGVHANVRARARSSDSRGCVVA